MLGIKTECDFGDDMKLQLLLNQQFFILLCSVLLSSCKVAISTKKRFTIGENVSFLFI